MSDEEDIKKGKITIYGYIVSASEAQRMAQRQMSKEPA